MKKYIIGFIIISALIAVCFYLVFSNSHSLTITYIKFKVNPEFVIGINSQDKVVFYNPLNDKAKIINLTMLEEKSLQDACEIIIDKLKSNNYLTNNEMSVTIITKNLNRKNNLVDDMKEVFLRDDYNISMKLNEPTSEELLSYSNETVYDLRESFQSKDLENIGKKIHDDIDSYVRNKIQKLNVNKLNNKEKCELINNQWNKGYFDDYVINEKSVNEYGIILSNRSNYTITFNFSDDMKYSYDIELNLEFDLYFVSDSNERKCYVENYKYTYNELSQELINNYKVNFYNFNC